MEKKDKLNDEVLLDKVVKDFKKAEDNKANYQDNWKDCYRLYKSMLKDKRKGANLFIPYTWATVEQLKARALQALFTRTPYCGFAGNSQDDVMGAQAMEDLVYWQMKDKIKLPSKFQHAMTSIFVYGTAIALYQWRYEEKTKKVKEDVIDQLTGMKVDERLVDKTFVEHDDPDVEFIPLDDFFPDPEGWNEETCHYMCVRAYKGKEYLLKMQKQGRYKLPENFDNDSGYIVENFRNGVLGIPNTSNNLTENKNKHELVSYYTDDEMIVVLNRRWIIAREENPNFDKKKPFIRMVAFDNEKEFWGESLTRIMQSLQEELNTTRNQRMDNVSMVLNRMWKVRHGADIDPAQLVSKAGNIIEVNEMNDIEPLITPDITGSGFQEEQIIKQDIQFVSAVSEYSRGATPNRKDTATAVTTLQEASNIVFNYVTMNIELTGLLPIANAIKRMNQQYMTEEKMVRLFDIGQNGWNYKNVDPAEIQGDYDVVSTSPRFEAQQTKEAKRGQLLEMFNTFMANPATAPLINVVEFMQKIMETYEITDFQKLIQQPPPPMQVDPMTGQPIDPMQMQQMQGQPQQQEQIPPELLQQLLGGGGNGM